MRRRAVLAAIAGGLGGLAGCSALPGGGSGGRPTFGVPGTTARDTTRTTAGTPRTTRTTTNGTDDDVSVAHVVQATDGLAFEPASLRIEPEDSVLWLNTGSRPHTVTATAVPEGAEYFASGGFPDELTARESYPEGAIEAGTSYGHTFAVRGVYDYVCIPHEGAGMTGRIAVGVDPAGPPRTADVVMTDALRFVPGTVRVQAGTEVVWENVGNQPHSVTAYGDRIPEEAEYWTSGGFESEAAARAAWPEGWIEGEERYAHTFETPGIHEYFCIAHEGGGMVGSVEVVSVGETTSDER